MSYTRAHLYELGLSLWRTRSDAALAVEDAASIDESAVNNVAPQRVATQTSPPKSLPVVPKQRRPGPVAMPNGPEGAHPEQAAQDAQEHARHLARIRSMDWTALEASVRGLSRPPATQAVFGVGARDASVFVVGEAPGVEEDAQGLPFVGPAGQLLDQMLRSIGLSRDSNVYIANICKFRPPNNRDPRPEEVALDLPYLQRQIQLVQPKLILAVGRIAAQNLLDCEDPIGRMRGKTLQYESGELPVIVTYHPAYLLRTPREKAKSWQDLKRVRDLLKA